ncbi:hypothetical protein D3C85_1255910 [compost metagenome]
MKNLIWTILAFCTYSISAQDKKCSEFKTGKFLYKSPIYEGWVVTRNDSIQTERNEALNLNVEGSIVWKDDCNYELTYSKTPSKEMLGKKIIASIIEVKGNEIICRARLGEFELELEMIKIE